MGWNSKVYFKIDKKHGENEYERHLFLTEQLISSGQKFESFKVYDRSIKFEQIRFELFKNQDFNRKEIKNLFKVSGENLVFVSEFRSERILKSDDTTTEKNFKLQIERIPTLLVTVAPKSNLQVKNGLNSWWDAGTYKMYDPKFSKRIFEKNRSYLIGEITFLANIAQDSKVLGAGHGCDLDSQDCYLVTFDQTTIDENKLLSAAVESEIEVESTGKTTVIYSNKFVSGNLKEFFSIFQGSR